MMNVLVLLVLTEVLAKMVKGRLAALVPQLTKDVHVKVSFSFVVAWADVFFPSTAAFMSLVTLPYYFPFVGIIVSKLQRLLSKFYMQCITRRHK